MFMSSPGEPALDYTGCNLIGCTHGLHMDCAMQAADVELVTMHVYATLSDPANADEV